MAKSPPEHLLHDLKRPLRDALRGVATLASATEDLLEATAPLVPEGLRTRFRDALKSVERAGRRLVDLPVGPEEIALAARFLHKDDATAADTCATVIVHAWEHLGDSGPAHRPLISETLVAATLRRSRAAATDTGPAFAARVLTDLQHSSAIVPLPGLSRPGTPGDDPATALALLSIGVWLLAARAGSLGEEERLLDLAQALVHAFEPEALAATPAPARLARFLEETAAHL